MKSNGSLDRRSVPYRVALTVTFPVRRNERREWLYANSSFALNEDRDNHDFIINPTVPRKRIPGLVPAIVSQRGGKPNKRAKRVAAV